MDEAALEYFKKQEAERRLKILGELINYDKVEFEPLRILSQISGVPIRNLRQWWKLYKFKGFEGLIPDWQVLDDKSLQITQKRYEFFFTLLSTDGFSDAALAEFVYRVNQPDINVAYKSIFPAEFQWSISRVLRWITRYKKGGLWAFAPSNNSYKRKYPIKPAFALAVLKPEEQKQILELSMALEELASKEKITNAEIDLYAHRLGKSRRTIRYHLARLKRNDVGPRERADKGIHRSISTKVESLVYSNWLKKPSATIKYIFETTCAEARLLNEDEPSYWVVRDIYNKIPPQFKLLGEGNYDEFRNLFEATTYIQRGVEDVWEMDSTPIPLLVRDRRGKEYRKKSEETRPILLAIVHRSTGFLIAAIFTYLDPNEHDVASGILRDGLLHKRKPTACSFDNGKIFVAEHVQRVLKNLEINPIRGIPHEPRARGTIESFFKTVQVGIWKNLDGYTGSDIKNRPSKINARYSINEIRTLFWKFVDNTYNKETFQKLGKSREQAYQDIQPIYQTVDEQSLDTLLLEEHTRKVQKFGIKIHTRVYYHSELAVIVGKEVQVFTLPSYKNPEEIKVYYKRAYLCDAFDINSERGQRDIQAHVVAGRAKQHEEFKNFKSQAEAVSKEVKDKKRVEGQLEAAKTESEKSESKKQSKTPKKTTKTQATDKTLDYFAQKYELESQ